MDFELKPEDLAFSEYPEPITGGMHVGLPKGVMAVHLPTGIKVVCNHERSQHMNRDACLRAISAVLNTRHGAGDAEDAAAVLAAMNDGYTVRKGLPSPYLTDEANASFAWIVERAVPPHCDKDGVSMWHSSTPSDAIAEARAAIDAARAGERG